MPADHRDPWHWRELLIDEIRLAPGAADVPPSTARGRMLASPVHSPEDVPQIPVAAMDGFAVRRADLDGSGPTTLPVAADLPARPGAVDPLAGGTAARIMTGAPVPAGADAVVPVEDTDATAVGPPPRTVTVASDTPLPPRRHIREVGEEVARAAVLAAAGDRVGAGLIGLARTLGIATLPVLEPPRVTIVVTGDELVPEPRETTAVGAIRESNGTMLAAALADDGVQARTLFSDDDPAGLRRVLAAAADRADLVVTTGGIGHGAYDVVKALLGPADGGAGTSRFAHLALRPGGPQGWGVLPDGVPVVHLPGTPVGALTGLHLFVRPLLPGADALPRRMPVQDPDGRLERARARDGLVAEPGRIRVEADGTERVALLPGRRLAPFGRADAIVLGGAAGGHGPAGTALVITGV